MTKQDLDFISFQHKDNEERELKRRKKYSIENVRYECSTKINQ